jgi:site-specific recombinase XerD
LSRLQLKERTGHARRFRRTARRPACFEPVFQAYLAFLLRAHGLKELSLQHHRLHVSAFLEELWRQGCLHWKDLGPTHIDAFTRSYIRKFSRRYAATVLYTIRRFLRYLEFRGLIDRPLDSLMLMVRMYQYERLPRYLEPAEVRRVLSVIDRTLDTGKRDYAAVTLLLGTGLRSGELCGLTLDDVSWRDRVLTVRRSKTGPGREVPIPAGPFRVLVDYVRHHRPRAASTRHLFFSYPFSGKVTSSCPPLTVYRLGHRMKTYLSHAGLKLRSSVHGLRHTFAQHLVEQGMGFPTLQALMGQRSLTALGIYARINMKALREVTDNYAEAL